MIRMFGLFLVVFSILANGNSLDLLSLDDVSNPGEDSPGTVYKAGQPGANWTPEEIDSTRQRILQAITPIWPEKIGKKTHQVSHQYCHALILGVTILVGHPVQTILED